VIGSAPGVTAVDAHRATDHFQALGRTMGEYTEGRAEVMRLREVE
jgi:quinol monooxygenase YgiN